MTGVSAATMLTCYYKRAGHSAPAEVVDEFRAQLHRRASGRVLFIGAHHMADLPAPDHLEHLALVASSPEIRGARLLHQAEVVDTGLEELPFPQHSFDLVACLFALCSAPDPVRALQEISRVLRQYGHLMFLEHTKAPGVLGEAQDQVQEMLRGSRRCRPNFEVLTHLQRAGLFIHRVDWSWPPTHVRAPLIQGFAAHPDPYYVRELSWLRGS
ncbi:class I SAM-dependent methyltransferase [Saccharopolyspora rectivirgula]|jgi:SAM-dependent methyltransferase|uniref:SAM-dependent methyltransferase n=1 Tax=Saccharopolyspora rectivirgula TaxID=28042 RepID=A0A073AWH8_9PSEU|nr:methyltransferase domain-containing protein [Saccharopolyspora rectivirgula]KEI43666.1 SAM-dependent methyltransferase [Saccharopolyspora rectivirgula]